MTLHDETDRAALDYWNMYQMVNEHGLTWRELGYTIDETGQIPAALVDVVQLISTARVRAKKEKMR